jgi:hypothetical protein
MVREAIARGRAVGSWTGVTGLTSSAAAAAVATGLPRAVGWARDSGNAVTFAYAAQGDSNLDGVVDVLDAANFLAGGRFDSSQVSTWTDGDFNNDAVVDILDAADFMAASLFDAGGYLPATSPPAVAVDVAAVPEPAISAVAVGMLALAGMHVFRKRHRVSAPTESQEA